MNNNTDTTKTGLGFLSILTLIFVVAKILGFLSWSWWLVFLPIWGPILSLALFILVAWIVTLITNG
ncbi:hypothetical protein [Companilactobacillus paralimentarius]|uniref:hypothetical protein n=1 Tax=Companilactobacillus paralimentarius TaxID=83526 RepID=UPI00384FEF55